MLLRRQGLFPAAKKHFSLFRDPFADDVQSHEDVFVSPDIRYVREAMFQTAKHGGFMAVAGESGAAVPLMPQRKETPRGDRHGYRSLGGASVGASSTQRALPDIRMQALGRLGEAGGKVHPT